MTDHVCAWAAASPARYRASSSSKAASMSSRSNATRAAIRSSASISTMPSTSVWNASGRWSPPEKRTRLRARRSPRVAMTVDVMSVTPRSAIARMFAISASRPCRTPAFTHRDGDRRWKCRRPVSPPWRPSRGPRSTPGSARPTRLAAFSSRGAGRLSSSNLASAASRSASSKSSQRLIRSPSTVRSSTTRHSASKPSCEVPCAAWVKTAPRSLSRCTASM